MEAKKKPVNKDIIAQYQEQVKFCDKLESGVTNGRATKKQLAAAKRTEERLKIAVMKL